MRRFAKLVALLPLVSVLSCENLKSQDMTVSVQMSDVVVINTKAKSCVAQYTPGAEADLGSPKTTLGQISITWQGKNPLVIQYMAIRTRSGANGKKSETMIDSTDLAYLWKGPLGSGTVTLNPSDSAQSTYSTCSFEIGGVAVPDLKKMAFGTGSVFIYGITLVGEQYEGVSGEGYFNWRFDTPAQ